MRIQPDLLVVLTDDMVLNLSGSGEGLRAELAGRGAFQEVAFNPDKETEGEKVQVPRLTFLWLKWV